MNHWLALAIAIVAEVIATSKRSLDAMQWNRGYIKTLISLCFIKAT